MGRHASREDVASWHRKPGPKTGLLHGWIGEKPRGRRGLQFLDSPHFQSCVVTQKAQHCKQLERSPSESMTLRLSQEATGPTLSLLCSEEVTEDTDERCLWR